MLSLSTLISLAIVGSASFFGVQAQCVQNAGYLGAYDVATGNFVGAVARTLGGSGIFTLSKNGSTSEYLAVVAFSNICGDGGPVFIQILSPVDPAAGYVSLTVGNSNCPAASFTGTAPWAPIAAADGFPHGQFPTPGPTRTTLFGGYGNLNTFCGENMVFALGTAVNREVLLPTWKDPNSSLHTALPVVQDSTFNRLLATPDPLTYSISNSGATVQQVYLSIFI
ncbi:hypothetical protein B0H17DRAFT_1219064 [Mycena rosella]|uniref:Uncharacterized protein n=1 Tax=Mycena rosella TaxID=1033263 RepID=A0AAD7FKB9_MYCRO|nr:hypothetical protein B0H17DRAFT_1219064 [Mycena rosella]